jgi:hypothetical protein
VVGLTCRSYHKLNPFVVNRFVILVGEPIEILAELVACFFAVGFCY